MAYVAKGKQLEQEFGEAPKSHKIRITLTSQDVAALEKGACARASARVRAWARARRARSARSLCGPFPAGPFLRRASGL
jgi:hypothetical protein